jgi:dethiobiotin synthetase
MKPIFVASTGEGTGKTAIAIAVAKLAQDQGLDVGYFKPKGTRLKSPVGKTRDEDPLLAKEVLDLEEDLADLEPVVYSPAFVEEAVRGNRDGEVRERVREHYYALAEKYDVVVVEGGGRPETGGIVGLTDPDVAELLDARTVVVGGYDDPSDVDGVLATARQFEGHLAGVLFNAVADGNFDSLNTDVVPFLESRDIPVLGIVPRVQELAGVTVAELAERGYEGDPETLLERMDTGVESDPADAERVDRVLTKWLSAFLDEGQAEWPMPNREDGFYKAFRTVARHDGPDRFPVDPADEGAHDGSGSFGKTWCAAGRWVVRATSHEIQPEHHAGDASEQYEGQE